MKRCISPLLFHLSIPSVGGAVCNLLSNSPALGVRRVEVQVGLSLLLSIMSPAYHKATQHTVFWLLIVLFGLGLQFAVLFGLQTAGMEKQLGAWMVVPAIFPCLSAMGFGWWWMARRNRQRVQGLQTKLESLGFMVSVKPQSETKASFWHSMEKVASYMSMNRGPEAVQWLALRGEEGSRMAAWEYLYTTGSGKSQQAHHFTALAWPGTHPELPPEMATWPSFQIARGGRWQRMAHRKQEIKLPGMELFQKKWGVYGNGDSVMRFLTPVCLAHLERSPKGECWFVGEGWVMCCFKSTLNAENFSHFWNHTQGLLRLHRGS